MAELSKIRILDTSQYLSGPYCTMILADLGCDVIKIEPPNGDSTRHSLGRKASWGESPAFLATNRNKRSVVIDLKTPTGLELFLELAQSADVVVENFKPGTAHRLGIDYEAVRSVNNAIVYASISGFGSTGPYAERGGFDIIAQGMSGIMSVTGMPDSEPCKAGVPITDIGAGMFCAIGILAGLNERDHSGVGCEVSTSLFEAGLAYGVWEATELWSTGGVPGPLGSAHRMNAPYQAIRASDGFLTIGANSDKLWAAAAGAFGHAEWITDQRFSSNQARLSRRTELITTIESVTKSATVDHWLELLSRASVPCGPVLDYEGALDDPQAHAREMVVTAEHSNAGHIKMIGSPIKTRGRPVVVRRPPPLLGEHTDEILEELGRSKDVIHNLRSNNIVA